MSRRYLSPSNPWLAGAGLVFGTPITDGVCHYKHILLESPLSGCTATSPSADIAKASPSSSSELWVFL